MDISIYTDESQLNVSPGKKGTKRKLKEEADSDSDLEPLAKQSSPVTKQAVSITQLVLVLQFIFLFKYLILIFF